VSDTKKSLKPPAKSQHGAADFVGTYAALKKILVPYEKKLNVSTAKPGRYWLETKCAAYKGKPFLFAGVSMNKNYVGYFLMPIYVKPKLAESISPELKKCLHGKSCFNFTAPDPKLFKELASITRAGFSLYQDKEFLFGLNSTLKAGRK
jgi:hypothetical protein